MSSKKHIVDTMRKLYNNKLISIRDGNMSFKPKNKPYFYISAGQVKKNEITEDQVVQVFFEKRDPQISNIPNGSKYDLVFDIQSSYIPSREIYMHSYLQTMQQCFHIDNFVVHAHPPNIIAYTGIHTHRELCDIKLTFPELNVGKIGNNVKYHEAGSYGLAHNCFQNLQEHDIVALERHGTLSMGSDIDKIMEDIETLEYYTGIELKTTN